MISSNGWKFPPIAAAALLLPFVLAAQTTSREFKETWRIHFVDSYQPGEGVPTNAIDGRAETFWHTHWSNNSVPVHPHEIAIDMGRSIELAGFAYLPRRKQPNGDANGRIDRFQFLVSADGTNWTQAARGRFSESGDWQTNRFAQAATARYFKLVSWSAFKDQPWASVAELDVLPGK